jgi:iron(III) transport system ATP-binding protein
MHEGRIQQIGRPRDVYERPANQFVADFVGNTNFLEGVMDSGSCVRTEIGVVVVAADHAPDPGARVTLSVRPEDVQLSETRPTGPNVWEARVEQKVFLGEAVDFRVTVAPRELLSRQHPTLRTSVGGAIFVQLDPEKCVVLKVG